MSNRLSARVAGLGQLSRRGARWEALWPLGLYGLLSLLLFGLPVVGDPTQNIIAVDDSDPSVFMWFFSWWPHALLNGLNPFVTELVFVPDGYNLQWAASMPLPSLLLAPVTLTAGPAVTYNLIMLASPALAAWTAFLLCRHVTGRLLPSVAGGYLFGFSPYMLTVLTGAPNLTLVPLVPVFALLVVRRVDGSLTSRRFVVAMAAALAAQYLISTEVLLTSTLFGGIALVVAFVLLGDRRREILRAGGLLILAFAVMAIVISPFFLYFLLGDHYPPVALYFSTDLAAFVLPPHAVALTNNHDPDAAFRGSATAGYLGLPLILLIAAYVWEARRSRVTWLLLSCLLVPAVASLGPGVIAREQLTDIPLPWELVDDLPLVRYLITSRFSLYVILAAALVAALWLTRGGKVRWMLALLVVVSLLPAVGNSVWQTDTSTPAFFNSGAFRAQLTPSDRVLAVPIWGPNERWQAESGFEFKLVGGYLGTGFPEEYTRYATWETLKTGQLSDDYPLHLRRFVRAKGVTAIAVDKRVPGPWRKLFGTLGLPPKDTGGVLLYRLATPAEEQ
jgi:hypothetical protein